MKTIKLSTLFIILGCINLTAPPSGEMAVVLPEPVRPYENIKHAIGMVEVGGTDTLAINTAEQAYGFFQIRQIRLNDYYNRTGIRYTLSDMLDYKKAEKVFTYFADRIGPYKPDLIIRRWNGSGPETYKYLTRVKNHLQGLS